MKMVIYHLIYLADKIENEIMDMEANNINRDFYSNALKIAGEIQNIIKQFEIFKEEKKSFDISRAEFKGSDKIKILIEKLEFSSNRLGEKISKFS